MRSRLPRCAVPISVRLPTGLRAEVAAHATRRGLTVTEIVVSAVSAYLDREVSRCR